MALIPTGVTDAVIESLRAQIRKGGFKDLRLKRIDYSVDASSKEKAQELGNKEGANIVVSGWYNPTAVVIYVSVLPRAFYVPLKSIGQPFYLALHDVESLQMAAPKSAITGEADDAASETAQLAVFLSALARMNARDYAAAADRLSDVLKVSTAQKFIEPFAPYFLRGTALALTNRFDEAVSDLTAALAIARSEDAFNNRGLAQIQRGKITEGLGDLAEAAAIDSSNPNFLANRALAYAAEGNTDEAIKDCNAALGISPEFSLALNNRGLAYLLRNDTKRALDDFNRALTLLRHPASGSGGPSWRFVYGGPSTIRKRWC